MMPAEKIGMAAIWKAKIVMPMTPNSRTFERQQAVDADARCAGR